MSDIFLVGKYSSDLKTIQLNDEGKSAYFPAPRCNVTITTVDEDLLSLSSEVVEEIVKQYEEWKKNGR